jgi:uncharacterized protein YkwD
VRRLIAVGLALSGLFAARLATTVDSGPERCFREKVNFERTGRHIPALRDNARMDEIASDHSEEMAARGTIYHNENLPNEPGVRPFAALGENVGMGPAEGNDGPGGESGCDLIHEAFMESPGHKANILDPEYRDLGVGTEVKNGTLYVTEIFYTRAAKTPKPAVTPKPRSTCG